MLELLPAALRHMRWQLILPMVMAAALVAPLVCGSMLGAWFFPKASPRTYRNLALATVSAAAVVSPSF